MSAPAASRYSGRDFAHALNEADVLREALIREVRALGTLYAVGKRRPITELPPEKQQQIRDAYADTLWASDYGIEMMGICTSLELAQQAVREHGPSWFYVKLPIDSFLPEDTVQGEWAVKFPESDAAELYENLQSSTMAVRTSAMRMLEDELKRLQKLLAEVKGDSPPSDYGST